MTTTLPQIDQSKLIAEGLLIDASKINDVAMAFEIDCDQMYELAGEELKKIKAKLKEYEEKRTSITGPINDALKAINDLFRGPKETLEQAETALKNGMNAYYQEQQRIADEARLKAEQEAREAKQKAEREAAEKRKAAEEAEAKSKEAEQSGDEKAAQEAAAQAAIANDKAVNAEVTATVTTAAALPVKKAMPKVKGVSVRSKWTFEVTDFQALPDQYKLPNEKALRSLATSTKGSIEIAGVRFYDEKTVAAGTA